jgi:hypothetical protein
MTDNQNPEQQARDRIEHNPLFNGEERFTR